MFYETKEFFKGDIIFGTSHPEVFYQKRAFRNTFAGMPFE